MISNVASLLALVEISWIFSLCLKIWKVKMYRYNRISNYKTHSCVSSQYSHLLSLTFISRRLARVKFLSLAMDFWMSLSMSCQWRAFRDGFLSDVMTGMPCLNSVTFSFRIGRTSFEGKPERALKWCYEARDFKIMREREWERERERERERENLFPACTQSG